MVVGGEVRLLYSEVKNCGCGTRRWRHGLWYSEVEDFGAGSRRWRTAVVRDRGG